MKRRTAILAGLVSLGAVGAVIDSITTAHQLAIPGHYEAHPIVRALLDTFGVTGGLIVGTLVAIGIFIVLAVAAVRTRPLLANGAALVLSLAVAARVGIIVWNTVGVS